MPIPPAHYDHPMAVESLMNLRAIKWFESLSKILVADDLERDFYLLNLCDNVLMTEADFPDIHRMTREACEVLGVANPPKIFLDTNPQPNSLCIGEKKPMLILTTGLLDTLNGPELAAALAHEIGHLACGHSYYQILAQNFGSLGQISSMVPGMGVAIFAIKLPLFDWYRKVDLTADRAALLVMKDRQPVIDMIGKMAGGSPGASRTIPTESLVAQAKELDALNLDLRSGGLRQKASYYFSNMVMQGMLRAHPWPAIRIKEILEWSDTDQARDLIAGKLPAPLAVAQNPSDAQPGLLSRWSGMIADVGKSMVFWGGEKDAPVDGKPGEKPPEMLPGDDTGDRGR